MGSSLRELGLMSLLALTLISGDILGVNVQPQIPSRTPDWAPDEVINLAVSDDGSIVAVATVRVTEG